MVYVGDVIGNLVGITLAEQRKGGVFLPSYFYIFRCFHPNYEILQILILTVASSLKFAGHFYFSYFNSDLIVCGCFFLYYSLYLYLFEFRFVFRRFFMFSLAFFNFTPCRFFRLTQACFTQACFNFTPCRFFRLTQDSLPSSSFCSTTLGSS